MEEGKSEGGNLRSKVLAALNDAAPFGGRTQLRNFLKGNFCEYLVDFYADVDTYKQCTDSVQRGVLCSALVKTYIVSGSRKQLNLRQPERETVEKNAAIVPLENTVFDVAMKKVMSLLEGEMWWKFVESPQYHSWKKKSNPNSKNSSQNSDPTSESHPEKIDASCACIIS
jgi:hypothetical protein